MTDRYARIALPLPLASLYTYRIPETLGDRVVPGARVVVPVRRRELIGIVDETDVPAPDAPARDVLGAPDDEPAVPPPLLETGRWIAGYYGAPLGLTLGRLSDFSVSAAGGDEAQDLLLPVAERLNQRLGAGR